MPSHVTATQSESNVFAPSALRLAGKSCNVTPTAEEVVRQCVEAVAARLASASVEVKLHTPVVGPAVRFALGEATGEAVGKAVGEAAGEALGEAPGGASGEAMGEVVGFRPTCRERRGIAIKFDAEDVVYSE